MEGVTFRLLLFTRWNSLVACFKICSLLVVEVACCKKSLITRSRSCSLQKSLVTCCKIRSLLVAKVAHCKKSLVVAKFARYSLPKLLIAKKSLATRCKIRSLLVGEVDRSKISLATGCKIRWLLVAEVARCKNSLVTHCTANFDCYILCKVTINKSQIQLNLVIDETI